MIRLLILMLILCSAAWASPKRDEARDLLVSGKHAGALLKYAALHAGESADIEVVTQYALALAAAGYSEAALLQLDRAVVLDQTDPRTLFAVSSVLSAFGHGSVAREIQRPAPEWLKTPASQLLAKADSRQDLIVPVRTFSTEIRQARILMAQSRFVTAVDRFARITQAYPGQAVAWAGYAVALEKIGAYKTAAMAVSRDLAARTAVDAPTRDTLVKYRSELESRPPLERQKPNELLKGRYTLFLGGGMTAQSEGLSSWYLNTQAGKYLTNRINTGVNLGYSNSSHLNLGITGRYQQPLPTDVPLSVTGGARIAYASAPASDNFSFLLSPGMSYFLRKASADLIFDIGVFGSQSGVVTLSLGYTMYFGGGS